MRWFFSHMWWYAGHGVCHHWLDLILVFSSICIEWETHWGCCVSMVLWLLIVLCFYCLSIKSYCWFWFEICLSIVDFKLDNFLLELDHSPSQLKLVFIFYFYFFLINYQWRSHRGYIQMLCDFWTFYVFSVYISCFFCFECQVIIQFLLQICFSFIILSWVISCSCPMSKIFLIKVAFSK